MARKVSRTAILPRPPGADVFAMATYLTDLVKSLYRIFSEQAQAINDVVEPNEPVPQPEYLVAALPTASNYEGHTIYVSDETGGATLAFSDGTNWRRAQDRAIVS